MDSAAPKKLRAALRLLPPDWEAELADSAVSAVAGMSGAKVLRVRHADGRETFLKIAEGNAAFSLRSEIERTAWLAARGVRVPAILRTFDGASVVATLSEALRGAHPQHLHATQDTVTALGRAVAGLHALPASGCPFDEGFAARLARARAAVARGEVDPEDFDARNSGVSPEALVKRLAAQQPLAEDVVVVHGDLTFDNILVDGEAVGFIDCGHAGRADRYTDLAVIAADIAGSFGRKALAAFARAYGLAAWDRHKLRLYGDLYELF